MCCLYSCNKAVTDYTCYTCQRSDGGHPSPTPDLASIPLDATLLGNYAQRHQERNVSALDLLLGLNRKEEPNESTDYVSSRQPGGL